MFVRTFLVISLVCFGLWVVAHRSAGTILVGDATLISAVDRATGSSAMEDLCCTSVLGMEGVSCVGMELTGNANTADSEFVRPGDYSVVGVGKGSIHLSVLSVGVVRKESGSQKQLIRLGEQHSMSFLVPTMLFALAPLFFLVSRLYRRGVVPAGVCANCGYDLRYTPLRCPECGTETGTETDPETGQN